MSASVHDVRHFAALLRGVNFANVSVPTRRKGPSLDSLLQRATVTISKAGFLINVEEARTLLGVFRSIVLVTANAHMRSIATAYVNANLFDEYTFSQPASDSVCNRQSPSPPSSPADNPDGEQEVNVAFEIPLNTLIECLNIFGTAGALLNSNAYNEKKERKWRRVDDDDEGGFGEARETRTGPMDNYFSRGKDEKRTGMRMSFLGAGYPLTLLMWVSCTFSICSFDRYLSVYDIYSFRSHLLCTDVFTFFSAEDSTGPTTTCEITTFDPEPSLELPFDSETTCAYIWLHTFSRAILMF